MRVVVAGGAGFLGSHLVERLLTEGHDVVVVDDRSTGKAPVSPAAHFQRQDVSLPFWVKGPVDWVLHLASPASPPMYLEQPIHTLRAGSLGTFNLLNLASKKDAKFLLASTSEVYGDPLVHPQPETYWGNVNPIGWRSCYDEAKRFAEAATVAYEREEGADVRIARIFNTYGPWMRLDDGRPVVTFIKQAIEGEPITVQGDGKQTRSFCYVKDTVEGLRRLMDSDYTRPMNIGNDAEISILELAAAVTRATGETGNIEFVERVADDPNQRRPDLTLAREILGWKALTPLEDGLAHTVDFVREALYGAS